MAVNFIELIRLNGEEISSMQQDFWHRSEWIDYCVESSFEKGEDCTVGISNKGKIIGFIPLIREGEEFTFQRSFGPRIFINDLRLMGKVTEILIDYAKEMDVKRIAIEGFIPGFIGHTQQISICELEKNEIRKSYKYLMKNKNLEVKFVDSTSDDIGIAVDTIKSIYYSIAKKITRPEITFEKYKDWIHKGIAFIAAANCGDDIAGFTLIINYAGNAYYFMSGTQEKYKQYNVSHFLQGKIIEYLRGIGTTQYVLGNIDSNSLLGCPNYKEKSIGFFKSGFGTIQYKILSEYFLDAEYFRQTYKKRLDDYLGAELNEEKSGIILP